MKETIYNRWSPPHQILYFSVVTIKLW